MDSDTLMIGTITLLFLVSLLFLCLVRIRNGSKSKQSVPARTMIILGSGGHTREMMSLVDALAPQLYSPRSYVYSKSDTMSSVKAMKLEEGRGTMSDSNCISISRSREVGQGWISSAFTTAFSLLESFYIFLRIRPDLIICNGPGVCVPLCIVAYLSRKLYISGVKIVYVESICRLQKLSLSGLMLRHIVDKFYVQWEHLTAKYPGSLYIGRLA